jgi:predicted alpha/beta-fold hydrolase
MNFALTIAENSYYTVVVTTRGIGAPLKTSAAWHPAFTDDAYMTLQHVHKTYGSKAKIFFSGFSVGSNIVLRTLLRNQQAGRDSIPVLGACCVCMVGNYSKVRDELEKSNVGRVYSCLMAHKQKEIIRTNIHAFRDSSDQIQSLLKSVFLSEFDRAALSVLYGFSSDEELNKNFSCTGIMELQVPYLGIQPRDDPLHQGNARNNIPYKKLSRNKNFIYLEPSAGNHFGFYEGDLMEAFSSKSCYTWPAKCAVRFFDEILDT